MPRPHESRSTAASTTASWTWLPILLLVLVVGALAHADERHASLFGVEGAPCPVRLLAGEHACPGCGLSRGTILAIHGRFGPSWAVNPAGILIALICAVGIPLHVHVLLRRGGTRFHERAFRIGGATFVVGIVVAWLVRLAG